MRSQPRVLSTTSHNKVIILVTITLFVLAGCNSDESTNNQGGFSGNSSSIERAPIGATPPPGFTGQSWTEILESARGQKVHWYMWGGDPVINNWVTGYVARSVQEQYDITLHMVPMKDATEALELVKTEQLNSNFSNGAVDLIWVNGENYRYLREHELLYGPWSGYLPNSVYVDWEDPSINTDFGYPVEGYESPYGRAQMVMSYDRSRLSSPPKTIEEFIEWIKENPGRFTYPAPPDFNGSAFIRHICYWAAGGYEQFQEKFDPSEDTLAPCFKTLNEIAPYLWKKGEKYPASEVELRELFRNGEVDMNMNYTIDGASIRIKNGIYPDTVRTFVFQTGSLANTNYVAIPFNSSHKAGAMVVANFLLSPEAQLDKWKGWGGDLAIDPLLLPTEWRKKVLNTPLGIATLPPAVLSERRLPEPSADWVEAIEQGWLKNVLNNAAIKQTSEVE